MKKKKKKVTGNLQNHLRSKDTLVGISQLPAVSKIYKTATRPPPPIEEVDGRAANSREESLPLVSSIALDSNECLCKCTR